ncbi:DUF4139 domain-containing protein [Jannaschia ovalis]|uniref:DUF4139 domain-containing protein n=1 Tax=Jannaschia ovalis TaxID=3038773 RepID=A0ABY8L8I2_9RHOB|nr:DUF4139 domain-containing protein [Jannaschia sp. GRR-S6-38]WGH77401.1 DUF4139 domain-containing protein [Jannaschia sp. GRR-S6-38]
MRLALVLAILPGLAFAEDVTVLAPVTAATIFPNGLTLTREGRAELPAGRHRLLIPMPEDAGFLPDLALTGAALGPVERLSDAVADGRGLFDAAQRAAFDAMETAEAALENARDAADRARTEAEAAEAAQAFWRSITGEALTGLDPQALAATAAQVAEGVAAAQARAIAARAAVRQARDAIEAAERDLAQARRDLAATGPDFGPVDMLAVAVTLEAPGAVAVTLTQPGAGGWAPVYDATLDEDAGRLTLARKLRVTQRSGLPMRDVALTLSTADPYAQTAPTEPQPDLARIVPQDAPARGSFREAEIASDMMRAAPAPALAEQVVAGVRLDGPVVTYAYPRPATLPTGGDPVVLALDDLVFDARPFARAVPRRDTTAFLMAEFENTTPEPILPGALTLFRGDARVGEARLPLIPAGDEAELAFGPLPAIRLEFVALDNETGDRGIITSSATRVQDLVYRIRNLSDAPETVETRIALPFSEQEALELDVRVRPEPDRTDIEDKRAVGEWVLPLAPGSETEIRVRIEAGWPEGQILIWEP